MPELLVKAASPDAGKQVVNIKRAENSCLKFVGFEVIRLTFSDVYRTQSDEDEVCVVVLEGKVTVNAAASVFTGLGQRESVFDQVPTDSVYVPAGCDIQIEAESSAVEVALCKAPHLGQHNEVRLIPAADVVVLERGEGTNKRYIHNIMMDNAAADSLLITEVYTPGGNWSSYPPHKHDTDNLPEESCLEETYYHRLNPPQGYAHQRVYTDDRSLDESLCAENRDTVMVPRGYHPVGAPHGYDLYYLNVMAGPKREWKFKNDPAHEWIIEQQ